MHTTDRRWEFKEVFRRFATISKLNLTFISVALETGTNFPAVNMSSLLAILMMKLRLRTKGTGVPTH
jgi:hypothetical protein